MASRDEARSHATPFRTRRSYKTSDTPDTDWSGTDVLVATHSPRRRVNEDIDASEVDTGTSGLYRRPGPTAKVPTTPSRPSLTKSSSMSIRNRSAAAPGLSRAATAPQHRWATHIYDEEDYSRSDSRRSESRRDTSPPSVQLYRSTGGSRPSSRTSLSESDSVTDVTTSTSDETPGRGVYTKRIPPQPPPPPRVPKPPKSRKSVIYEEAVVLDRRDRRPRLRREDTLHEEEDRWQTRSKSKSRREELSYPQQVEVEHWGQRAKSRRDDMVSDIDSEPESVPKPRRGEVIYEEDREVPPNPFLARPPPSSRGPSRAPSVAHSMAPSTRQEKHQSSVKEHRRGHTVDKQRTRSPSRQRLSKRLAGKYYETEVAYYDSRPPSVRKARTTAGSSSQSAHSSARRPSSFLESFLGPAIQPYHYDKPVKLVECVICMDDEVASHKAAKLKCGHRMCHKCLKDNFRLSVRDPQHMPPRCCTTDHIPIKHVERLFDASFKKQWNKKYAEFSTRNRIYCPSRRCGEWIKPEHIHRDVDGRKYAKCGRCHTKVCYACNGKWHSSRDCPRDEDTHRFLEQAKQLGWQRCHRCKAMVELKEGCNHMTCRCGAEFCMICGSKWKTCDCPWFSHEAVEADRLEHMQIPTQISSDPLSMEPEYYDTNPLSPRDFRSGTMLPTAAAGPRTQSYGELLEQRDGRYMRRMRSADRHDVYDDDDDDDYTGRIGEIHGIGHQAGHHMNDDYRRRPETIIVPPAPHTEPRGAPQQSPYDRTTTAGGTDYVSGVHRARGVRSSSMERRLADRFNSELRNAPMRTHTLRGPAPAPPPPPMLKSAATMPIMPRSMGPPHMMAMPHHPPPGLAIPFRRRHTMEEDLYNTHPSPPRSVPRLVTGRTRVHRRTDDFDEEEEMMTTPPAIVPTAPRRSGRHRREADREHRREPVEPPRPSTMAGLTGPGRGMDRVFEWVNYVEDEPPLEDEKLSNSPV